MQIEKTVFISYRRTNAMTARAVYQDLTQHGYDVFLDYDSIDSGGFAQIILNQIASRAHFVVILTPSALERCAEPNDWLRKEIEYALETKRNIVPLMFEGFDFKAVQQYLVEKLAVLPQYNALNIPADYFDEAMGRLRTRFLNKPLDVILHPTTAGDRAAAAQAQANEVARPNVLPEELTAEQWLEHGLKRDFIDFDRRIADYTEAIRLNPNYSEAYARRGGCRVDKGDFEGAMRDFNEAIRINPREVIAYFNRGLARFSKNDLDGAIADFSEVIRLNPKDAEAYRSRGVAYDRKGDLRQANADYKQYIDLGGKEMERVWGYIRVIEEKLRKGK